jgi:serpin B
MFKLKLLGALVLLAMTASCSRPEPIVGEDAKSSLERLTAPAPASDVTQTVRGLNDFTLALHRKTASPGKNVITAPASITTALGMASAGAAGSTLDAFRSTLNVTLPQADFHGAMNTLDRALTSRGQKKMGTNGRPFTLSIVNQTFAQKGFHLEPSYLDLLAQQYGTGLKLLDFVKQPEPARHAINDFVSYHTADLIPELLGEGTITSDTRVVLANAVYFNASWESPFEKNDTSPGGFTLLNGTTAQVPMLRDGAHAARSATVNGVEVVELPYQGNEVSMLLLMPPAGGLPALEESLNAAQLEAYVGALTGGELEFSMPKFEIDLETRLEGPLSDQGLGIAFSGDADFSAMTGDRSLSISGVVHHAVIKVTEEGTEAAGATAIVFGVTSIPLTRPLHVDRPFAFFIRDNATGALLFMGHVVDPR